VAALKHYFAARFTARVEMPPLQSRPEDIPLIVRHIVRLQAQRSPHVGRFVEADGAVQADCALLEALLRHRYTLHVRELEELLGRAALASANDVLTAIDLPIHSAPADERAAPSMPERTRRELPSLDEVSNAMVRNGGNRSRVCRELGLRNRFVLYRLLKKDADVDDRVDEAQSLAT
jgi:two-component system nitrogen regulation response regulator GlnG/two-component system response regulator HydG